VQINLTFLLKKQIELQKTQKLANKSHFSFKKTNRITENSKISGLKL